MCVGGRRDVFGKERLAGFFFYFESNGREWNKRFRCLALRGLGRERKGNKDSRGVTHIYMNNKTPERAKDFEKVSGGSALFPPCFMPEDREGEGWGRKHCGPQGTTRLRRVFSISRWGLAVSARRRTSQARSGSS